MSSSYLLLGRACRKDRSRLSEFTLLGDVLTCDGDRGGRSGGRIAFLGECGDIGESGRRDIVGR